VFRTNLATRPFYNERAAHVVIGVVAALVLAITAWNVVRIVSLSRHNTELSARIGADRAEAGRLTAEAARIRQAIDKDELAAVVGAAQEANTLIDLRTFSWTEFFNHIESTLPPGVMLTSVRPSFKAGVTNVAMSVLSREAVDLEEFMDKLEATGAFTDVVPASQDRTDDGLVRAVVEGIYIRPAHADAAPASEPAAGAPRPAGGDDPAAATQPQNGRGRQ
jgi:Tfp pilus assembly protein PilN